jgi:hypothetical protein
MPRAWLCARGNDLPFALTTEQLYELGYGNISMKPFAKIAPLIVAQKPLTEEVLTKLWGGFSDDMNRQQAMSFARAIERAHEIGEKE